MVLKGFGARLAADVKVRGRGAGRNALGRRRGGLRLDGILRRGRGIEVDGDDPRVVDAEGPYCQSKL